MKKAMNTVVSSPKEFISPQTIILWSCFSQSISLCSPINKEK